MAKEISLRFYNRPDYVPPSNNEQKLPHDIIEIGGHSINRNSDSDLFKSIEYALTNSRHLLKTKANRQKKYDEINKDANLLMRKLKSLDAIELELIENEYYLNIAGDNEFCLSNMYLNLMDDKDEADKKLADVAPVSTLLEAVGFLKTLEPPLQMAYEGKYYAVFFESMLMTYLECVLFECLSGSSNLQPDLCEKKIEGQRDLLYQVARWVVVNVIVGDVICKEDGKPVAINEGNVDRRHKPYFMEIFDVVKAAMSKRYALALSGRNS